MIESKPSFFVTAFVIVGFVAFLIFGLWVAFETNDYEYEYNVPECDGTLSYHETTTWSRAKVDGYINAYKESGWENIKLFERERGGFSGGTVTVVGAECNV